MKAKKAAVAMSGGVDSSVAALLLKEVGYDVTGITLKLFDNPDGEAEGASAACCSLESVNDARRSCDMLGIRHYVFNFKKIFLDSVILPFCKSYAQGLTPNPCVFCNKHVKFRFLMDRIHRLDFDYLATGHYAIIEKGEDAGLSLKKGLDPTRDQSYFLYMLTQKQLKRLLFPVGGLLKTKVREIAAGAGLPSAKKKESRDICFAPAGGYAEIIRAHSPGAMAPGPIIGPDGKLAGTHNGIANFTIGQRRGTAVAKGSRVYVSAICPYTNTVFLGEKESLMKPSLIASDVSYVSCAPEDGEELSVQIRYNSKPVPAVFHGEGKDRCRLEFSQPQKAVTPGQAAVFFRGDTLVGGGMIEREDNRPESGIQSSETGKR